MMRRAPGLSWILALLGGLAALPGLGCGRPRGEPIRVAFAGPTSGPSAEEGLAAVRAIEIVFERENAAGGVRGRPLALDVYDDANDPQRARTVAETIADQPDTVAVIGHNLSSSSIAAGGVYAARGVPAVTTAATSGGVTRDNPWYFRVIYNDLHQGRFVTAYVGEVLEAEGLGLVHEIGPYGAYLAEVIESTAPEVGLALHGLWSFDPADTRLEGRLVAIADAVVQAGPEVLLLAMGPDAGVKLVTALRERDFTGDLVVTDALASQAFAGGFRNLPEESRDRGFYTDGIYASIPFLFDIGGPRAGDFASEYLVRYDVAPGWYAAFAADAASVIVEALRRAPDAGKPDRPALREALAAIDQHAPVEGVTGPTWFDPLGDADKPVIIGRFLNGEIVSAFAQLRLLPESEIEEIDESLDPRRVIALGDDLLYRTDVAQVGVRADRFEAVDFEQGIFELDFEIWFRHAGQREVEQVQFTNAVDPIELGEPVEELVEQDLHYRRYRASGRFYSDTVPTPYGGHSLALSVHHRKRTRDDLVLAIDPIGMDLGRSRTRAESVGRARRLLGPATDWTIDHLIFFERDVDEHAMGHPDFMTGERKMRSFSELTIGVTLKRQVTGLRGLIPPAFQLEALGLGLVASALLLAMRTRRLARLRFVLQAVFAILVLAAVEPVLGDWLVSVVAPSQIHRLSRAFDVLWWLVPAALVNGAIQRFLWGPMALRTGNPVPTILRYSVVFIVYLLAIFGIIAFVYDYKLTGLLATSGVLAMVIGLAVQLNITNIFAGVAINLERPFRVGDWIMIHGRTPHPENSVIGMVVDINWRTTRLRTADDTEIVIPNGVISESTVTNFMAPSAMSRFELLFTVDQSVPPDKVIPVIQDALDAVTGAEHGGPLADPAPTVRINRTTENGIEYIIRYRIVPRDVSPQKARHTINESVIRALRAAGIELAYPRRRIREERPAESDA